MHFSGEKYSVRPQQGHNRPQTCVFEATSGHNRPQTCGFQATSGHNRPQTCRNKARPCGFKATSGQLVWFRDCFLGLDFQQFLGDQVVPVLYTCLPVYATPNLGSKNLSNSGFACVGLPCARFFHVDRSTRKLPSEVVVLSNLSTLSACLWARPACV